MQNYKGQWCRHKPIICQEGFCSECEIFLSKNKGGESMSGGAEYCGRKEEAKIIAQREAVIAIQDDYKAKKRHDSNQVGDARKRTEKMQFDEDNKVIISTLNPDEARAFILFLHSEIKRHYLDIRQAQELIELVEATRL